MGGQETQVTLGDPDQPTFRDPFETAPKLLAGQELPSGEGGSLVLGQGRAGVRLAYAETEFPALVGKEIELVLYAPRGESQVFEFRIEGITDHDRSSVALALPDRLAMLAWWYNDPDYLATGATTRVAVLTESSERSRPARRLARWPGPQRPVAQDDAGHGQSGHDHHPDHVGLGRGIGPAGGQHRHRQHDDHGRLRADQGDRHPQGCGRRPRPDPRAVCGRGLAHWPLGRHCWHDRRISCWARS